MVFPAEGSVVPEGDVFFMWNYIDLEGKYKEKYNLMVVRPSFNNIQEIVIDSITSLNKLKINLETGKYQCRIYALNGSSYSDSTIHSFTVKDSTDGDDLSNIKVKMVSPADASVVPEGDVFFMWNYIDLEGNYKEKYNLMVVMPGFNQIQKMIIDTTISSNKISVALEPGQYQCWVYALNNTSYSDTTIHSFVVSDTTKTKSNHY
jgi:hypothetical protein